MNFLQNAIQALGPDFAFRLINEVQLPSDYMLARYLPEMNHPDFVIRAAAMTVHATLAQPTAKDSPYAKGGAVSEVSWLADVAKTTLINELGEQTQIQMRQRIDRGGLTDTGVQNELLTFVRNVAVQGQWDAAEMMRGQAIATGKLNWVHNGINLSVDYGVPSDHRLTTRTGNDAYHGSASKWWDDVKTARSLLGGDCEFVAHYKTIESIIDNPVNRCLVESGSVKDGYFTIVKKVSDHDLASSDVRDRVTVQVYSKSAKKLNANGSTEKVPFVKLGAVAAIGSGDGDNGYRVGMGQTISDLGFSSLGYTHIAPTVEADFQMGRWAEVYSPEGRRYRLVAESVTNLLPVVENPALLVLMQTEMPA